MTVSYLVFQQQRHFLLILLGILLVSCQDKKEDMSTAPSGNDSPRRSRSERGHRVGVQMNNDELQKNFKAARKLISAGERDKSLVATAWNALESSSEISGKVIEEISFGTEEKNLLIEAYIQMLLAEGKFEEAEAWAKSLGNEIDITTALSKIGEIRGHSDPEKDALALSESDFTGEMTPQAEEVVRNWAARDPNKAAEWLRKMPEEEARANGFRVLIGGWLAKDSPGVFSWASSQTDPQFRQEAMTGVVGFLNEQPAPIRNSLLEGADETVRSEILQRIDEVSPPVENRDDSKEGAVAPPEPETPTEPESEVEDASEEENSH